MIIQTMREERVYGQGYGRYGRGERREDRSKTCDGRATRHPRTCIAKPYETNDISIGAYLANFIYGLTCNGVQLVVSVLDVDVACFQAVLSVFPAFVDQGNDFDNA